MPLWAQGLAWFGACPLLLMSCGSVWGVHCERPGFAVRRCGSACVRAPGHAGTCSCAFHLDFPFAEQVQQTVPETQALAIIAEPSLAEDASCEVVGRVQLRSDHPPVYGPARASRALMRSRLASAVGRRQALKAFDRDIFAPYAQSANDELWSTWVVAAEVWGLPPVPLTLDLARKALAAFKVAH